MACNSGRHLKFIKAEPSLLIKDTTPDHESSSSSAKTRTEFIIENMSSIGSIRVYSTNPQHVGDANKRGKNDPHISRTLSDDEEDSVLQFIESIEGGTKGWI